MGVDLHRRQNEEVQWDRYQDCQQPTYGQAGKSFSLSRLKRSFVFTSEKLMRIPESILPPDRIPLNFVEYSSPVWEVFVDEFHKNFWRHIQYAS